MFKNNLLVTVSAAAIGVGICLVGEPTEATVITYYDSDFEDGTFGGGTPSSPLFEAPVNISSNNLDGKVLEFGLNSQLRWRRFAPDSNTHLVSFDYFAEPGANVTQFLDIPQILRLDVNIPGRHHIDVYYDLNAQTAQSYLNGVLDTSLLTILAWPDTIFSRTVRIANQTVPPGNSTGVFQIDNFLWQGNVAPCQENPTGGAAICGDTTPNVSVPEPFTGLGSAMAFGLGIFLKRKQENQQKVK